MKEHGGHAGKSQLTVKKKYDRALEETENCIINIKNFIDVYVAPAYKNVKTSIRRVRVVILI